MSTATAQLLSDVEYLPMSVSEFKPDAVPPQVRWNRWLKVGFRFAFCLWVLFSFPFPLDMVPGISHLADWYSKIWELGVPWAAAHVLHLQQPATYYAVNGSGDTVFGYVQALCFLALATIATAVWSLLDSRRTNYQTLHEWLRLYVRLYLGTVLLSYGAMKFIPAQMPAPGLSRLMESYGQSSPMGLLWTFMGASPAYSSFTGSVEMLAGLLLFVPRLTGLGSLLAMTAMTQVFVLNLCYDVPVKLFSAQLLLMAAFLAAPDAGRLFRIFVLGRNAKLSRPLPLFRRRWLKRSLLGAQLLFGATMAVFSLFSAYSSRQFATQTIAPPLYGIWSVEQYSVDGIMTSASLPQQERWGRLIFDRPWGLAVEDTEGQRHAFALKLDTGKRTFTLTKRDDPQWKAELSYGVPQTGSLQLQGRLDGHQVDVRLRHVEPPKFVLTTRGFHWVNEFPFNR